MAMQNTTLMGTTMQFCNRNFFMGCRNYVVSVIVSVGAKSAIKEGPASEFFQAKEYAFCIGDTKVIKTVLRNVNGGGK